MPNKPATPNGNHPISPGKSVSQATRLAEFYNAFHHDDRVLVVITADPDSIASAVALKRLLWRRVAHIHVASTNRVRRPDNLKLLSALALQLPLLEEIDLESFDKFVTVDSQPHHNDQMIKIPFSVVIDHHPLPATPPDPAPLFRDIRPEWGATASVMASYLKAARVKPNKTLATALFYAIKTDTQNFVRQGQLEDMRAFRWLYPLIHQPLLSDIERAPIGLKSFEVIKRALQATSINKQYAHAFVERLDHPDTLVIVADFLMQINAVNRSVVAGVYEDRLVVVMRSAGVRSNLGRLAAQAFGKYGSAGGHKNMARAEMPLEALDPKVASKAQTLNKFVLSCLSGVLSRKDKSGETKDKD
ncbi:MAG: DHH family phosphoesterase [Deltaproteobacteria bacterium]|jgi:nanoRNase/pAp phosphatase (c-di-AMP/oligoRNAs hydrolase)|nr:DHH family phosphoesterase [Deltaproteobacteria bacterium]